MAQRALLTVTEDLPIAGTCYQRVRDRLRADILSGALAPGSRIKVVELATRYGLSQMPVREAIQQLQGEGLVLVVPNRGATVRVIDRDFVSQVFDIRIALEGALARRAALVMTPELLEQVRKSLDRHVKQKLDTEAQIKNNIDFHQTINSISGNVEAIKILDRHTQIIVGLKRRIGFGPKGPWRLKMVIEDHQLLFDALAARDEDLAQRHAENHIRRAKEEVLDSMPE